MVECETLFSVRTRPCTRVYKHDMMHAYQIHQQINGEQASLWPVTILDWRLLQRFEDILMQIVFQQRFDGCRSGLLGEIPAPQQQPQGHDGSVETSSTSTKM